MSFSVVRSKCDIDFQAIDEKIRSDGITLTAREWQEIKDEQANNGER